MKKKLWYVNLMSIALFSLLITFHIGPAKALAEEGQSREIDITLTPEKVLFDLDNLKPGDWSERKIVITNSGTMDAKYKVSARKKSGDDLFYQALELTILGPSGELYKGALSNFENLEGSTIATGKAEELTFTIKIPETLGNEYQGMTTEVEIIFYAEGIGGVLPIDGPNLPTTATDYFNLLAAGIILIGGGTILLKIRRKLKLKG